MFLFSLCILTTTFLFQRAEGGWLEEHLDSYTSPVIRPVEEAIRKLQANLDELEVRKQELELHKKLIKEKLVKIPEHCQSDELNLHVSFFNSWNLDSCVNLTDDWKSGADLAMQGAVVLLNVSESIGVIGSNILDCPSKAFLQILPCYNENLLDLKKQIVNIRRKTLPFIRKARTVAVTMKNDFEGCVGIHHTLKNKIEKHIENIRC
ncbi:uncharacterized protein [Halyomorpha halys]|uniref:uncharacterized protein n=1 Tax=Halyomorpha halys TaxID=286706 RepID=UPI0006D4C9BF|nr:uncharacterized protein LOC106685936 [Halyomorpha halys]